MKPQAFLLALSIAIFSALMLFQLSVVSASPLKTSSNLVTPVTSATYALGGNVSFRLFKLVAPVVGVVVKSYNSLTGVTYTTATDSSGNYSFSLEDGTYSVSVSNSSSRFVVSPASQSATIKDQDVTGVSFIATIKR